jgi:hypothetical protein
MKHKPLILRKLNELNNLISGQDSAISRLESPLILKDHIEKFRIKMNEIEVLLNNEEERTYQ